jgi:hypothetical protein
MFWGVFEIDSSAATGDELFRSFCVRDRFRLFLVLLTALRLGEVDGRYSALADSLFGLAGFSGFDDSLTDFLEIES